MARVQSSIPIPIVGGIEVHDSTGLVQAVIPIKTALDRANTPEEVEAAVPLSLYLELQYAARYIAHLKPKKVNPGEFGYGTPDGYGPVWPLWKIMEAKAYAYITRLRQQHRAKTDKSYVLPCRPASRSNPVADD